MTRIMVTGDKHLGLISDGMSRYDEQKRILDHIIDLIYKYKPDIYVDLGDLFDSSSPSPKTYTLAIKHFLELIDTGIIIKILVGNHDKSSIGSMNALDPLNQIERDVVYEPCKFNYEDKLDLVLMPYITDNEAKNKSFKNATEYYDSAIKDILNECTNEKIIGFSHLEVEGANFSKFDVVQREVGLRIPNRLLEDKRLVKVYGGHIHTGQELDKVTIVGSSIYVNFSESLDKKGIYLIEV